MAGNRKRNNDDESVSMVVTLVVCTIVFFACVALIKNISPESFSDLAKAGGGLFIGIFLFSGLGFIAGLLLVVKEVAYFLLKLTTTAIWGEAWDNIKKNRKRWTCIGLMLLVAYGFALGLIYTKVIEIWH